MEIPFRCARIFNTPIMQVFPRGDCAAFAHVVTGNRCQKRQSPPLSSFRDTGACWPGARVSLAFTSVARFWKDDHFWCWSQRPEILWCVCHFFFFTADARNLDVCSAWKMHIEESCAFVTPLGESMVVLHKSMKLIKARSYSGAEFATVLIGQSHAFASSVGTFHTRL